MVKVLVEIKKMINCVAVWVKLEKKMSLSSFEEV